MFLSQIFKKTRDRDTKERRLYHFLAKQKGQVDPLVEGARTRGALKVPK